jgi:hypothetical protein
MLLVLLIESYLRRTLVGKRGFEVRTNLSEFFQDDHFLSPEEFGALARDILEATFKRLRAGATEEDITNQTLEEFSRLLQAFAASERKRYWQEFKRLYDAGVIKQASFIDYVMTTQGYTHQQAVQYVAETFGMKISTQSVYLSDEFNLRKKEKERARSKRK